MTRFRLPLGRSALFVVLILITLLAIFPLRIALSAFDLDDDGLSARSARGSVWAGTLRETNFGRLPIGDLRVGLQPLPLLAGRARIAFGGPVGVGALSVARHRFGIDDTTIKLPLAGVFAPIPLSQLDLDDVSIAFRDGRCDSASGRVRASFTGEVAGLSLAQGLSGTARCDAGALLLPLVSTSAMETLNLRITGEGRYRAELSVRPSDPALATRLTAAGFRPGPQGFVFRLAGTL